MKPSHKHFFSSLKQVEKRLKLDDATPPPPPPPPPLPPPKTETQQTESLSSSPIYFLNQLTNTSSSTLHDEQPPREFLSINDDFQSNPNKTPFQLNESDTNFSETSTVGDIDSMIRLLRLSDFDGNGSEIPEFADDEFYDKIVKVKGPRCKKEVERLDGWIKHLLNNGGGSEPLRLAHLLLAKAAFIVSVSNGDGDRVEFPSTIDEFLRNDPPSG